MLPRWLSLLPSRRPQTLAVLTKLSPRSLLLSLKGALLLLVLLVTLIVVFTMRAHTNSLLAAAGITSSALAQANSTLASLCSIANVQAALPVVPGITFDPTSVTADAVTNTTISGSVMYPDGVIDFCNVTLTYSHDGLDDKVIVAYWLPAPSAFKNRFLSTGGGGYAINSGITAGGQASLPGGTLYGAVSGATDGGFGSFNTNFDLVYNAAGNGTQSLPSLYMFGYKAIHEMTVFGKEITKNIYAMGDSKLYAYYQGCSEGGRDGWSQVQRFEDQFDGAVTGAPAFRLVLFSALALLEFPNSFSPIS